MSRPATHGPDIIARFSWAVSTWRDATRNLLAVVFQNLDSEQRRQGIDHRIGKCLDYHFQQLKGKRSAKLVQTLDDTSYRAQAASHSTPVAPGHLLHKA